MRRTTIVLLAAICALTFACSRAPRSPDVVVIVLDTARPDYLSVYGHPRPTTPFLEDFARAGVTYDRAYSTSSWTLPAHASLFTGTPPEVHGATQANPRLAPDLPVLAERLSHAGYQTFGVSNNAWVAKHTGMARGFDAFQERRDTVEGAQPGAGEHLTVQAVKRWLAETRDPARPSFLFVNLIEPHMPYRPTFEAAEPFLAPRERFVAAMQRFFPPKKGATFTTNRHYAGREPLSDAEWADLRALYEGELRLTDAITRAIVAAVDAAGDPANTLVFLVSDHGENLGDHGHLTHVFNLYDSNLRIALLARGPGFAPGTREERLAQISDLYPTILRAAGLDPEPACVGLDLRGALPQQRLLAASLDRPKLSLETFAAETRQSGVLERFDRALTAAVSARYKLIRGSDGTSEVYDLLEDPSETRPLTAEAIDPAVRRALDAFLDIARSKATTHAASDLTRDPDVLRSLRALGYVE